MKLQAKVPQAIFRVPGKQVIVGPRPCVIGVLSSLPLDFAARQHSGACDVVEVRLDRLKRPADWLARCQRIEAAGWPVLLTIRSRIEGGNFHGSEAERLKLFQQGMPRLSAVDIELSSSIASVIAREATKRRKVCVISFHDFAKTPPLLELENIVRRAQRIGTIVKISTMIRSQADAEILKVLLAQRWKTPLCVIGMGTRWRRTRITFPAAGSCLTYGYLDDPTAPGQWPAARLVKELSEFVQGYGTDI